MTTTSRRLFKALVRLILLGLFVVLPLGVALLYFHGLPSPLTRQIVRSLSGPDYRITIGRLSLHPLRGPVAEDVTVLDRNKNPLLQLDRLSVALNLTALLHRRIQVEALDLDQASMRFPLADGDAVRLDGVNARLLLPPGKLRISRAEVTLEGIHLSIRGTLLHPHSFDPASYRGVGGNPEGAQNIVRFRDMLRELRPGRAFPRIEVTVSGDLTHPNSLAAEAISLRAEDLRWRELYWKKLEMDASYREGTFDLPSFHAEMAQGARIQAQGSFDREDREGEIFLQGSVDPRPWLRSFDRQDLLPDVRFTQLLGLFLHARIGPGPTPQEPYHPRVIGRVEAENFLVRDVPVDYFAAEFAWQPEMLITRGARIVAPAINATLDARLLGRVASLRGEGFFTPTLCLPWLDKGMQRVVKEMEFGEPAEASISLEIPLQDSGALTGAGTLRLGPTAMRGAWIEGATADLVLGERAVRYENLALRMDGGLGTGVFVYDFGRREVRLENIQSTVPPSQILRWVDPRIAEATLPYRFRGRPDIRGDGVVDMANPDNTRLDLQVKAPGMNYELLGQDLSFSSVRGGLQVRGRSLQAKVERAELFGGSVRLETTVSLDRDRPEYELAVWLRDVDFASINRLYFDYEGSHGSLSGEFAYRAEFARQTHLQGKGKIRIENGNVFAIPVLGPLSPILNSIVPGTGYQTARLATADFTVANETISTDNLEIMSAGFSLYGRGDIRFVADELDMTVRLNAQGAPGVLLLPVSKIFEYASAGTLSDPRWRPRHLPREVYGEGLVETVTTPVRQLLGAEETPDGEEMAPAMDQETNGHKPRKRLR